MLMLRRTYQQIRKNVWNKFHRTPYYPYEKAKCLWIDSAQQIYDLIPVLKQQKFLAIDTETNSLYAYKEQVCLLQIGTFFEDYIIDPLAFEDPTELFILNEVTRDKNIVKIFHGSDYDIAGLKRDFLLDWNNIFDTYLAARYLLYDKIGLSDLVYKHFGIELDKSLTKFNWSKRPIPEAELRYAREDVRYLGSLYEILRKELEKKDIYSLVQVDFQRLAERELQEKEDDPFEFMKIKGAMELNPIERRRLKELYTYREKRAKQRNVPSFKVLSNQTLYDLARLSHGNNFSGIENIKGIPHYRRDQFIAEIKGVLVRSQHRTPINKLNRNRRKPSRDELNQPYFSRKKASERLKEWRVKRAIEQIHPNAVLPNYVLESILKVAPESLHSLSEVPYIGEERIRRYGPEIIDILHQCKL